MHYYQHNIGDYRRDTSHLSLLEHGAYRQLIDTYYLSESPIPTETEVVFRRLCAKTDDEKKAVLYVLNEMFIETPEGWIHKRCNEEILKYKKNKGNHWAKNLSKSERASIQANRNASKVNATPKWLTKKQKKDISNIYAECALKTASTGIKYEVDHIVPLRSKNVCGLHVSWNLQVIEAHKNRQKSNFFEVA